WGQELVAAKRPRGAELAFAAATARDPRARAAHQGLLELLSARGRWREVREAAARLLGEVPDDPLGREMFDPARTKRGQWPGGRCARASSPRPLPTAPGARPRPAAPPGRARTSRPSGGSARRSARPWSSSACWPRATE